ncbi:uncharacterized protein LOC110846484 isoform X2 [Folsomia candida]|uniref:uncharacterized protein LOC110846484 isoform X2 n=1 Tax=Folsomia candida TaxID=158441 RepID=UPI000B90278B|nr:uncharacterized protein LOC110846484 isoform X2 [Folsomia candida]
MGLGLGLTDQDFGFEKVTKVKDLLPVLKERLPNSCNVINMAKNYHKFQNEMTFYILRAPRDTPNDDLWIIVTYAREDYGIDINISAPRNLNFSAEFKTALVTSGVIEWDEPFIFAATDASICNLIQDAVQEATGKDPSAGENLMFYASPQYHPLVTQFSVGSTIEVKPLDVNDGAKFLVENWPFARTGSHAYVRKLIERNCSSGVYVDNRLVCGAALNGSGMITMLHTLPEFRHKGYATLCMNYFVQTLFKDNLIPCCTVETTNIASISLQRKIGLQVSHDVSYIPRS